ncbi:MAG: glycerate kinase [Angelakisella sp.]
MNRVRKDADLIMQAALRAAMPDTAVAKALTGRNFGSGRVLLVAVGKAAWQMAKTACDILGEQLSQGVVITKYDHSHGALPKTEVFEAGHPVPDENSFAATQRAIELVQGLSPEDTVILLISGGGSALFEQPLIPKDVLESITNQLLRCGAGIIEMNTVRKRLSAVKGGRFAQLCSPAKVFSIVLSDIIGDPLDMIASGPAYPDSSTCTQALEVVKKYRLELPDQALALLYQETPKVLDNVETAVTGSVRQLCRAAEECCLELGYQPVVLTASLCCTARDAGSFLATIAQYHSDTDHSLAFIAGGETVVQLTGKGMGGRNQELALAAAPGIAGLRDTLVFSLGSDGTDGPTDAAGGCCDGETAQQLAAQGIDIFTVLANNDSYHALERCGGLLKTGATGTNVNDLSVLLLRR